MENTKKTFIFDMTSEEIQTKIEKYLPVRKKEKDKFGEVFTPLSLINELLYSIPLTIWKDPEAKWLDPANGIGNFFMMVYQKLMKELPDKYNKNGIHYATTKEKGNHIIKNMLYMIEINPNNVKVSQQIFGPNANICCCDFLDEEKWRSQFLKNKNKQLLFDVIVCNPPFQIEQQGERKGAHGNKTLWDKFIIKSLNLLKYNGFLAFITPSSWRRPENKLYNLMTKQNQLIYLHIFGEKQTLHLFNVLQRVDLYVIEKKPKYQNTIIVDELGKRREINLSNWEFLPNYNYDDIKEILKNNKNYNTNDGIQILYNSTLYERRKPYVKEQKTEKYKYPIAHSINKKGIIFSYTDEKIKGHFGQSKVILGLGRNQYPINDYDGKYGMSLLTFGIPITSKKQGDDIVKAINTDEFKEIIKATKWTAFQTDWRMFKHFNPDFYKHFLKSKKTVKNNDIKFNTKKLKLRQSNKKVNKTKKQMYRHFGGNILGQGTHGTISIDTTNVSSVIKTFTDISKCKGLQNEYLIQTELASDFISNHFDILVPQCCCYNITERICSYKMTRIYPFPNYTYYLIPNFAQNDIDNIFGHSTIGYEVGINPLINKYKINIEECVFKIGKMFSYLHYVKMLDGYDCEIIIGSLYENQTIPNIFLIDFDKIQKFVFELNITVYRKIDEQTIDEKILTNAPKFARFLFGALISMSLLPINSDLKRIFIAGYATYLPSDKYLLQQSVFEQVIILINEYAV